MSENANAPKSLSVDTDDARKQGDAAVASDEAMRNEEPGASVDRRAAAPSSAGVDARDVAIEAARAASDKKADDVEVLDLSALSDVCDYFVLATGSNTRLVDAVVDEVEEKVAKACGEKPFSIEGRDRKDWILMDYGSVVVHVFTPEARDYYRLEKLWGDAPVLNLELD